MIKLFRKIRHDLIFQKRIGKYLLYAIGEIILVVVGILIALNLNIKSRQRISEAKIDAIFGNILQELSSDIYEINGLMKFYEQKDSVFKLVLNNKLTYDDYANPPFGSLFSATSYYDQVVLKHYAFDNLIENIDAIPTKYNDITNQLKILYITNLKIVEIFNEVVRENVENNLIEREKYEWYSLEVPVNKNEGMINYFLNDFRYKNKIKNFRMFGIENHLKQSLSYRNRAIQCYKKIAALLNQSTDDESFITKKEIRDEVVGKYGLSELPDFIVYVFEEDKRLFRNTSLDSTKIEVFVLSKTKFMDENLNFSTLVRKDNNIIIKTNDGLVLKKEIN
ncbi:MAG: hypothetical protein O6940_12155 [Ignavibacteria bacterium]|nr:hypothetical protein [Ignavibacteria bacterium]